jgi:hypothetical protein
MAEVENKAGKWESENLQTPTLFSLGVDHGLIDPRNTHPTGSGRLSLPDAAFIDLPVSRT